MKLKSLLLSSILGVLLIFGLSSFVLGQCNPAIVLDNGFPIITNPQCGDANGSIEVRASGSGTITYSIDGVNFQASGLFDMLVSGNYTISLRDDNLCIQTISIPLSGPSAPVINSIVPRDSSCTGDTGRITVNATGSGLQYSIDDGVTFQSSNVFTGLAAGNYTVTVQDSNGCSAVGSTVIADGGIVVVSVTTSPTSCSASNGSIVVAATGNGAVQYSLDGVNFQGSGTFTGLAPASYTIRMRDASGCTRNRGTIVQNTLAFTAVFTDSDCNMDNGSIVANVTSAGTYSYSIDGVNYQATGTFTNLPPARYTLRIRDDVNGCIIRRSSNILETISLTNISVASTPSSCVTPDGTITAMATGTGVQYSIDGGVTFQTSGLFTNVAAGTYTVLIQDAALCEESREVVVDDTGIVEIRNVIIRPSICAGSNGRVRVEARGIRPLQYSLDGINYQLSAAFTNLAVGNYTLRVLDVDGCEATQEIYVPEDNDIFITSVQIVAPTTACSQDGEINLTATGTNVEFSIDNVNFQSTGTFTGLNPGTYVVFMRNSLGCTRETGEIEMPGAISIDMVNVVGTTCNDPVGTIEILATGVGLEFSLDNVTYQPSNTFTDLAPGSYRAYVRDADGCVLNEPVSVIDQGGVVINSLFATPTRCGDAISTVSVNATTAGTMLEYSIDGGPFQSSPLFNNVSLGPHDIVVRDDLLCTATGQVTVPESFPIIVQNVIAVESICDFDQGFIEIIASGGTGNLYYSIDGGTTYGNSSRFSDLAPGVYDVSITDDVDCVVGQTIEVPVRCFVRFPSAITPNANGQNDLFRLIFYTPLDINVCRIFNRWGELVFQSSNFSSDNSSFWWNGADQVGTISPGLYYYEVQYEDEDGATQKTQGTVQVIQ